MLHSNLILATFVVIVYLIVYYFAIIMMFITAMTIGYSKSSKKGSNSVIAGLIIYFIQQGLGMISIFIMFLLNPNLLEMTNSEQVNVFSLILVPTITYIILIAGEIVLSHQFLKNKLNLE